jgi:hypothetical protein
MPSEVSAAIVTEDSVGGWRHRVSWGAILSGVALALAVQLVLTLLGIGVGLSIVDTSGEGGSNAGTASVIAVIWWTISGIFAAWCGGMAAGTLSGRLSPNVRGWHGLSAWAVTTLIVVWLLTTAAGNLLGGALSALGSAVGGASQAAGQAVGAAAQGGAFSGIEAQVRAAVSPNDAAAARDAVVSYARAAFTGDPAQAQAAKDRAATALARAAGISPEEARARVDDWESQYKAAAQQAEQKARAAAEAARKATLRAGIFGFIALLFGALAGWFGAHGAEPEHDFFGRRPARRP